MERLAREYGGPLRFTYGPSTGLVRQVKNGLPAKVAIVAGEADARDLPAGGVVTVFCRAELVFWSDPPGARFPTALTGVERIAIANPQTAPFGRLAMSLIRRAGLEGALRDRLVVAPDAEHVMAYARSGNVDAAFVPLPLARDFPKGRRQGLGDSLPYYVWSPSQHLFATFLATKRARSIIAEMGYE